MKTKLKRGLLLALIVVVVGLAVMDYRYEKNFNAPLDPFSD